MSEKSTEPHFSIQRIYVKDLSFESPLSPEVFLGNWEPQMQVDLNNSVQKHADLYEVIVHLTVTVKQNDKVAFVAELQQAGIFNIQGLAPEALDHALNSYAPSILFPYAREVLTDIVMRGGFPQLILAPVNFDAVYQSRREQAQKAANTNEVR